MHSLQLYIVVCSDCDALNLFQLNPQRADLDEIMDLLSDKRSRRLLLLVSSPALIVGDAGLRVSLAKHQTGIRIDRVLFKQFQEICNREKLRPGEAVESLLRLAVQAGSITGVSIESAKAGSSVRMFDDALFRSRLARLKTSLELEQRYWEETGKELEDD
jgi:hypothetical protein